MAKWLSSILGLLLPSQISGLMVLQQHTANDKVFGGQRGLCKCS